MYKSREREKEEGEESIRSLKEENRRWGGNSLWFSGKKGERESSSGSGEEKEGAKVCSAAGGRGGRGWKEERGVRHRM